MRDVTSSGKRSQKWIPDFTGVAPAWIGYKGEGKDKYPDKQTAITQIRW
jgi:hypothetical protein